MDTVAKIKLSNTNIRYGWIAMIFHWGMALLIIGMLGVGLYMAELPLGMLKFTLYKWHKQCGMIVLILAAFRLGWRWASVIPRLPTHMTKWQQLAAHGAHYALYFFMFANPLTGWMLSSAAGISVSFFGVVLPDFIMPNEGMHRLLSTVHAGLAYGLIVTLCAHMGAAFYHHFFYKDDILRRMLP